MPSLPISLKTFQSTFRDADSSLLRWAGVGQHREGTGVLAVLLSLTSVWITWKFLLRCRESLKLRRMSRTVPSIGGVWPILGPALKLAEGAPWDTMTRWAKEYGSIYKFSLFGHVYVVLSDPHFMKEVMRTKITKYHKDVEFAYRPFLSLLGTGIVTSDGPKWRKQRNKVSAAFRIEVLSAVPGMSQRAVERLAKKLDEAEEKGASVEIGEEMRHLTLQVISEALLSLSAEEADGTFATVYMPIVVEGHKRVWNPFRRFCPLLPAWWAHIKNQRILNDYITGIVRARWDIIQKEKEGRFVAPPTNGGSGADVPGNVPDVGGDDEGSSPSGERKRDILDKVLESVQPGEWGTAAVMQIRDEMKTFVLAGHETSASMLNWSLFELVKNGDLMDKVVAESEQVFGREAPLAAPLPSTEELRGLQFTEACLRETLRKYSVVPIVSRRCVEDTTICEGEGGPEHFIPKGCSVSLLIKARFHEREDLWPEPMRYNPSRFAEAVAPYTFLPFIDGPRNCLGQHLSLLESKVVLSLLVNRYEFSLVNANAGEPNAWMIPTIPEHGTHVTTKRRRSGL
ncbi:unnamed protein product [Pylaiella littoralis]